MTTKRTSRTLLALSSPILAVGLLAGCGSGTPTDSPSSDAPAPSTSPTSVDAPAATDSTGPATIPTASAFGENIDLATQNVPITPAAALEAAQQKAQGTFYTIELDFEQRNSAWEYELGFQHDRTEYEVSVDAVTGKVVDVHKEATDDRETPIEVDKPLPYSEALSLAQEKSSGRLTGWSLEADDGHIDYSFDFDEDGKDVDVTVDTATKRAFIDD
ncbi:PepSY domain-containing protein [Brevibacterium sp. 50QC2O2]|uniref:PepSY domain-containing protein n=1 Tax=Brevibacterium sp. 50QC2O2 TaxID=2968459 RepID=UPI00211D01DA|nr:PepSY domain-containing protein [Brevibacterium sp. 50QC2O2]MCQ9388876.1 PepSY domain-containing protein [Brevibacterium sp. 50QC2O2]